MSGECLFVEADVIGDFNYYLLTNLF